MYIACTNPLVTGLAHDPGKTQVLAGLVLNNLGHNPNDRVSVFEGITHHPSVVVSVLSDLHHGACPFDLDEVLSDQHHAGTVNAPAAWDVILSHLAVQDAVWQGPCMPHDYFGACANNH